jgi:hypothetical protein
MKLYTQVWFTANIGTLVRGNDTTFMIKLRAGNILFQYRMFTENIRKIYLFIIYLQYI